MLVSLNIVSAVFEYVRFGKYALDLSDSHIGSTYCLPEVHKQSATTFFPEAGTVWVEIKTLGRTLKKEFQMTFIYFLDVALVLSESRLIVPGVSIALVFPVVFLPV
jgi:hypothetical protein